MADEKIGMQSNVLERHAQTVLVLLLVALLLWVGNTTQSTAVAVAEMRVELAYLKALSVTPSTEYKQLSKRCDELNARLMHIEREHEKLINQER